MKLTRVITASNKKAFAEGKGIDALLPLLSPEGTDNMRANAAKALWAACDGNGNSANMLTPRMTLCNS